MSLLGNLTRKVMPDRFYAALRVLKDPGLYIPVEQTTYNQDRLATSHNCDFIRELRFADAYQKGKETKSWGDADVHWRAFVACWAADRGSKLEGDFVECGVNRGGLSRAVMEYIEFDGMIERKFYLLDTYDGLSEEHISDEEKKLGREAGGYEECYESVKKTFEPFRNAVIVRGTVPETLSEVESETIAYLSIDMNCVEPEIAAAEYFWDKLSSGAAIVLDDYGWAEHILQKKAFDEFAARKNVSILTLPTGQGLILKP